MKASHVIEKSFRRLRSRLDRLESRYNRTGKNLHLESLAFGDSDLFPLLVSLTDEGLKAVRACHPYFSTHALYDDGMFWYELFLAITAASARIRLDAAQAYIPDAIVDRLLKNLIRISRYSAVHGGDIAKRNHEALGNTLLEFYSTARVRLIREAARMAKPPMRSFLKGVIHHVERVRVEKAMALRGASRQ